jgi:ADP-heptose:LPS heptosyltransferase
MKIIISPYSRKLRNGNQNPKNYPYWQELVEKLNERGYDVIQIGVQDEVPIKGVIDVKYNLPLEELKALAIECYTFISVDNFFPHLMSHTSKRGIVLWGRSDPKIFGYSQNINLLKDVKYLRSNQFDIWESIEYNPDIFIKPDEIIDFIINMNGIDTN